MTPGQVEEFDVVVVGGGPGGSTLAALVALQGHRVVVIEKEEFPRYQIGESLLPSTVHGVCKLTGVADKLEQAGFTYKRGGTFRWGASPDPWTFSFSISPNITGATSYAYQVERAKFDKLLLDHARSLGVEVRERCSVSDVLDSPERVQGVRYTDADGIEREVRSTYVVDASGNRSRIYQRAGGTRNYSEFFRSLALFGYFEGGKRLPEPNSGNILSAAFDGGWFWYIPLSPTLTSVGAVVRQELASRIQGDPGRAFAEFIAECPLIADYLADARPVTDGEYSRLRVRKDYSYNNTSYWRPGMVLIGDAACFVDPVFSSGVHLATYSALLAARSINSVLSGRMDEEPAFAEFEARYRREYGVFYEFLVAFYDMHVSKESYFWSAKKITRDGYTELESFVNLVGGISSGEGAFMTALKSRSDEFTDGVENMIKGAKGNMQSLFKSSIVKEAMQEGAQVQVRALWGKEAGPDKPLFPGGLIASDDGLFWSSAG